MNTVARQSKSPLVTAIGWITIAASGVYLVQIAYAVFAISPILLLMPVVILAIALATVGIVVGRGLLKRRNWARIGMIIFLVYVVVSSVVQYVFFGADSETASPFGAGESGALVYEPPSAFFLVMVLIVCGLGIYALSRPTVKKEFGA